MKKILSIFLFISVFVYGQDTNSIENIDSVTNVKIEITIEKSLSLALDNNRILKQVFYDLEIAQVQKDRTFADLVIPSLTVGGSVAVIKSRELTGGLESSPDQYLFDAQLSKVIFTGLRNWNANERQKVNLQMLEDQYDESLKDLVLNTQISFYNTFVIRENYLVYLSSQKALSNRMQFTYIQYRNGLVSEYEYLNSKVQFENTKPNLSTLSNNYQSQKLSFLRSIGIKNNADDVLIVGDLFNATNIVVPNIPYDDMLDTIMQNNIDLKNMERSIEILEYNKKIAQSYFWPNISASLGGSYGLNDVITGTFTSPDYSLSREWEPDFNVGITLSYSLDSLFPFSSAAKQAEEVKLNVAKLEVSYDELRDTIEIFSRDLIATSRSKSLMLLSQSENVDTAEYAYTMAVRQYRGGTISLLEVNDAEIAYLNAQLSFIQSIFEYYSSTLQIMKLLNTRGDN